MQEDASKHPAKSFDIEALRAYAISITVIAHAPDIVPEWTSWSTYYWLGGGVDLFFAISGLLITRSLITRFDAGEGGWTLLKHFWLRRALRLWPAAVSVATGTLVVGLLIGFTDVSRFDIAMSWLAAIFNVENLYITNCVSAAWCGYSPLWHYWSLSLEEQFYVALPILMIVLGDRRKHLIWAFLVVALWQATLIRPWPSLGWFMRSDSMLFGSCIALSWRYFPGFLTPLRSIPKCLGSTSIIALGILLVVGARESLSPYFMGIVSVSAGLIVLLASLDRNYLYPGRLCSAILRHIGSRSYSIYLVHLPVFALAKHLIITTNWQSDVALMVGAVTVSVSLAEFCYRHIEQPGMRLGRTIYSRAAGSNRQAKA